MQTRLRPHTAAGASLQALDRGTQLASSTPSFGEQRLTARAVRVLVVDDHGLLRRGLRQLLDREQGIATVGEAASAEEAIAEAHRLRPDVVVLDVLMPGRSGIEALPALLEVAPEARVLMLSVYDDSDYVREAFAAGAQGYVLKEAADLELIAAVREVAEGGCYLHPSLGGRVLAEETTLRSFPATDPLSAREREVFRLLALGYTNQEIANTLEISARTVETHRGRIMKKLRLRTRAELVRHALEHPLPLSNDGR